ncbi:hypothetical protein Pcinc_007640 [Petrolisthes cinctipes]|uniref:Chitin-binding type-4 domain-containing protein n=1 Tax=Petrolisthes cinctipes TaxID=88211 RepID=A0AAE1EXL4_PETCI|nr:hypothetical protein Pcinc_030712 [Petrolisthes cinctipes]KAK3888286.1 hypothetical protein Pcinc_007640 [Petrolisthes cinctipes]
MIVLQLLLVTLALTTQVESHMSLEEPPARNVMWRMGFNQLPRHEDDDYLICTEAPGAPCPPCGDTADSPLPHPHEGGGKWATGIVARSYSLGQTIDVHINVTRSHGGFLEFKLCPHNKVSSPVTQACLNQYPLEVVGRRSRKVKISAPYDAPEMLSFQLKLPAGVTCDQCVLQMSNTAKQFKPQTIMFRNCADIAIQGTSKTSFAGGPPVSFRTNVRTPVFAPQPDFPSSRTNINFPGPSSSDGFLSPQPDFISTRGGFPARPHHDFHNSQPARPSEIHFPEQKQHKFF